MYFIHGGRATGKTTLLIQQSAMTGVPIMAMSYHRIAIYKDRAKEMGLRIPEPILWKNKQEGLGLGFDRHHVLIDDGEHFIDHLLMQTSGVRCAGMTICEPVFELAQIEKDPFPFAQTVTVRKMSQKVHTYGNWKDSETEE